MVEKANPVVFIHGLWLHATSWEPWQEVFGASGYQTVAPGWPGDADTVDETRAKVDDEADRGLDEITEHYATVIDAMPTPPILVGHSFGGLVAEKLLGQGRGAAAVAIDAAQMKGVLVLPLAAARTGFPVLRNPKNKHRAITLSPKQIPVQLRQHAQRRRIGDALRQVDNPWTWPSAVRGGVRSLLSPLA